MSRNWYLAPLLLVAACGGSTKPAPPVATPAQRQVCDQYRQAQADIAAAGTPGQTGYDLSGRLVGINIYLDAQKIVMAMPQDDPLREAVFSVGDPYESSDPVGHFSRLISGDLAACQHIGA